PGVSSRLKVTTSPFGWTFSNVITLDVTEMPRCCSIFIQSLRARRACPRALTSPARWIAPPCSSSFSVSVVLPASGCEMIANVRRLEVMVLFLSPRSREGSGQGLCGKPRTGTSPPLPPANAPTLCHSRECRDGGEKREGILTQRRKGAKG